MGGGTSAANVCGMSSCHWTTGPLFFHHHPPSVFLTPLHPLYFSLSSLSLLLLFLLLVIKRPPLQIQNFPASQLCKAETSALMNHCGHPWDAQHRTGGTSAICSLPPSLSFSSVHWHRSLTIVTALLCTVSHSTIENGGSEPKNAIQHSPLPAPSFLTDGWIVGESGERWVQFQVPLQSSLTYCKSVLNGVQTAFFPFLFTTIWIQKTTVM